MRPVVAPSRPSMQRQSPPPPRFIHAQRQRLERAADHYLQRCYRTQTAVRASEFAKSIRVTHRHLSRAAPRIVGKSLRQFLRAKQLAYAETLLRATPLTVAEIAVRSGFGTETTFHRCFRDAYGMTPAHFREVKK